MKTYPLRDEGGRLFAFEVPNGWLGRRSVGRVLRTVPGVVLTRTPKLLSTFREDVFYEFLVEGEPYEVWEPFGDNSRYWIGPCHPRWLPQTARVLQAFELW